MPSIYMAIVDHYQICGVYLYEVIIILDVEIIITYI